MVSKGPEKLTPAQEIARVKMFVVVSPDFKQVPGNVWDLAWQYVGAPAGSAPAQPRYISIITLNGSLHVL